MKKTPVTLAVDIGNTNVKFGVFAGGELQEAFYQREEIEQVLQKYRVRHAILSRTGSDEVVEYRLKEKKITPLYITPEIKLPVKNLYRTPQTLGADRIAGSVAAKEMFPQNPVLKIDFGTCITFDFVSADGSYLGGAISPGMNMRFKALHNYTAKLPLIDPLQYHTFELTGNDTATSIVSGVINGIKNEVKGIINEYGSRYNGLKVVTTGGDAALFATLLESEIFARPFLVLEGLNIILNFNISETTT